MYRPPWRVAYPSDAVIEAINTRSMPLLNHWLLLEAGEAAGRNYPCANGMRPIVGVLGEALGEIEGGFRSRVLVCAADARQIEDPGARYSLPCVRKYTGKKAGGYANNFWC